MSGEFNTRGSAEARTHQLFAEFPHQPNSEVYAVAMVFRAMYLSALPQHRIETIASAMTGLNLGDLSAGLGALVRGKVLRCRTECGQKFFEVNY